MGRTRGKMHYSDRFKEAVMDYVAEGHSIKETIEKFGINISTLSLWKRLSDNTKMTYFKRQKRKINLILLEEYVIECPFSTVEEIADYFDCSKGTANTALREIGYYKDDNRHGKWYRKKMKSQLEDFSDEFKLKIVEYIKLGLPFEEVRKIVNISSQTFNRWLKELEAKGLLDDEVPFSSVHIVEHYIKENPDSNINEICKDLGLSQSVVRSSLRKLGYIVESYGSAPVKKKS